MDKQNYFYQTLLKEELIKRTNNNPRYSLRSFAKNLELSPAALSQILAGKKLLTFALGKKIVAGLALAPNELKSFWLSVHQSYLESDRKRKDQKITNIAKKFNDLNNEDLTFEIFTTISDWYYYAILQLIKTEDFVNDSQYISTQLGISKIQAKLAIEKLLQLNLIENKNGVLRRTQEQLTTADQDVTHAALKKRIAQITNISVQSLENDPISKRNHTTMTMSIDPKKIPIAKNMIQTFMDDLSSVLESKNKQVYELQINLFPLQKGE